MTANDLPDDSIVILYVEDHPDTLVTNLKYLRENWSPESRGVRSRDEGIRLIEEDEFKPDVVIHDCRPLAREDDEVDNERAGDELYAYFVSEGLPVVVLSGSAEASVSRDPYRSDPPLAWFSKPIQREFFHQAVEAYRGWKSSQ